MFAFFKKKKKVQYKSDIKENPQLYRGNIKLLSGDTEDNYEKELKKLRKKVLNHD